MAQILNTLQKEIANKYQKFDPSNIDHVGAYYLLRYKGKQHPTLRFSLEEPHKDVVNMMMTKLSEHAMVNLYGYNKDVLKLV